MKYFFGTRFLNNCLSRCALTRRTAQMFIHFQLLWTWAVPVWVIALAHASYWVTMSLSPVTIVATHSKHMPGILGRLTHGKLLGTENTMSLGGPRACHWPSHFSWTEFDYICQKYFILSATMFTEWISKNFSQVFNCPQMLKSQWWWQWNCQLLKSGFRVYLLCFLPGLRNVCPRLSSELQIHSICHNCPPLADTQ